MWSEMLIMTNKKKHASTLDCANGLNFYFAIIDFLLLCWLSALLVWPRACDVYKRHWHLQFRPHMIFVISSALDLYVTYFLSQPSAAGVRTVWFCTGIGNRNCVLVIMEYFNIVSDVLLHIVSCVFRCFQLVLLFSLGRSPAIFYSS
jgi:hypothetical protein